MPSAVSNSSYNLGTIPLLAEVTHVDNRNNSLNTTGKFPIYLKSSYLDRSTAVIKHGDTISVTMSNPSGDALSFVTGSQGTSSQQYPTPTQSGNTFSLYWPSSLSDNSFQSSGNNVSFANDTAWPFKGLPNTGNYGSVSNSIVGGGTTRTGHQYSRKIRISVVTGQIAFDGGAQTKTITQGSTSLINIIGSNITGLPRISHSVPASGGVNLNNPSYYNQYTNKLYVSVWNSSGAIVQDASVSGRFSNPTSGWIGIVRDAAAGTGSGVNGTGNNDITFNPAGLAAGTYSIYLNHNSPSFGGDTRTKQDSRMWRITLIVADNQPTPSSFDFTDKPLQARNSLIESNVMTPSGYNTAGVVSVSSGNERAFRVAGGTWYAGGTTGQTISPGQTLQLRVRSVDADSTSRNVFVSIGGLNSTSAWTVTTAAAASDISPDAFGFINVVGVASQAETSDSVTLQGYDANTTITALATGTTVSINGGTFTNVIGTSVPTSASVRIQITPGSSFSTPYTGFVKIGATQSTTWTVTTAADTSGTAVAPVTGSADYGVEIKNDNSNIIFSPDFRNTSFVKLGNGAAVGTTSIAQGATRTITGIEGALANNSTDIIISLRVTSESLYKEHKLSVLRTNGGFTITNNGVTGTPSAGSRSVEYMVMRV